MIIVALPETVTPQSNNGSAPAVREHPGAWPNLTRRSDMPKGIYPRKPTIELFWEKVLKTDSCWLWQGTVDHHGYGRFCRDLAHRWAYKALVGPLEKGEPLHHRCHVRRCVNPEHLSPMEWSDHARLHNPLLDNCPKGHPFDEKNTGWQANGTKRYCRTCHVLRQRRWRKKGTDLLGSPGSLLARTDLVVRVPPK